MQEYYQERETECEICGGEYNCKHHFFPKGKAATLRYDEDNLISICVGCHLGHHMGDPRIHATVIKQRGEKWYNSLLKKKEAMIKKNPDYYREIIKKYEQ